MHDTSIGPRQPAPTRRHWLTWGAAALGLSLLGACAATGGGAGASEAALLERATAYWAATRANRQVDAWAYEQISLDPRWTIEAYLKRGGIVFNSVRVLKVRSIEGDRAVVDVEQNWNVPQLRLKNQQAVLQDRWVLIDGKWYHAEKRPGQLMPTDQ